MECNCTSSYPAVAAVAGAVEVPEWARSLISLLGGQTSVAAALVGTLASFGFVSVCVVLPYLMRICKGQDIVSECLIGKSIITFSVDATGNGLHAAKKLVVDVNHRRVGLQDTGTADSPPHTHAGAGAEITTSEGGSGVPVAAAR